MSGGGLRAEFLYKLPSSVHWEFCRIMDGLSDMDWTRFASEVLRDQTSVRLAERRERRTDWVMNQWENRNGRVGELIDLLEHLQLLRPRDVILCWMSSQNSSSSAPPPRPPPVSLSQFDPPPKSSESPPTLSTCRLNTTVTQSPGLPVPETGSDSGPDERVKCSAVKPVLSGPVSSLQDEVTMWAELLEHTVNKGGGRRLPRPDPPPSSLRSNLHRPPQLPPVVTCSSGAGAGVMCWAYEEVHAGTQGFSPSLQVGEGGFGVVYRATLRNTDCAVKRLKQDCPLDWTLLRESFQNEVDTLTKFRHPNIVDLLGFSDGGGSVCLIYSYMENRSVEDQLHSERSGLSWSQRVAVVEGAAAALQFLHSPPDRHTPLIHGDVKSSNILLDRYLVPKLADFGLARFVSRGSSGRSAAQTSSVGKTATVRGTLAYLPDEYVRNGELSTAVDVYSFGVVLLEVLTGRRALEKDRKSGERYLKDLVEEVEGSPAWREQLDHRLLTGASAEPAGSLEVAALACRCLDKKRKKRPAMTEVFDKLQDIHNMVRKTSSAPLHFPPSTHSFPRPPSFLDSSVGALSNQLSKLGPLEDMYQPSQSSSSFCSLTPPHPLHSSSSLTTTSSSLAGPCETDESQGFPQFKSNDTTSRSLSPSIRDQYQCSAGPIESKLIQPSVPTEDQYSFPPQPSSIIDRPGARATVGAFTGSHNRGRTTGGIPECLSPAGSLQSSSPGPSVHVNPTKQRFLEKMTRYEQGWIETPELLSSNDLYGSRSSEESRGPEESDELDYLPDKLK